jgi:membrane-bound metal-dependent hydrolase YbcI (DUF457 family)
MNPITHGLVGWCLAESIRGIDRRERSIIVFAGIAPDLDGFGLPMELATRESERPLLWWSEYHHVLGHNLAFASILAVLSAAFARSRKVAVATAAFIAAHLHLAGDLVGSRGPDGYDWPIPYWYPFSERGFSWEGQWALNAWPNLAITIVLLTATLVLAWQRGYSPVGLLSRRTDGVFVGALHRRFPRRSTV